MSKEYRVIKDDRAIPIREGRLKMFAESVGWQFRIRGSDPEFTDYVAGVDPKYDHVISEINGGTFHVDICELTGKKKPANNDLPT